VSQFELFLEVALAQNSMTAFSMAILSHGMSS
jgi:hypothetical protein